MLDPLQRLFPAAQRAPGAPAHHRSQEASKRAAGRTTCRCSGKELLRVIRKYVNVNPDAIQVSIEKEDGHEVRRALGRIAGERRAADIAE